MNRFSRVALSTAVLLVATGAQAAFVNTWSFNVATAWTGQTFTSSNGCQSTSGSEISWGGDVNGGGAGCGTLSVGVERSGVQIENSPQAGSVTTNSLVAQQAATFSHTNNPISGAFGTLATATLGVTLNLTPTSPAGPAAPAQSISFNVNFSETPNSSGTCVPEATSVCDDIFVLTAGSLNNSFVYDSITYFVSFVDMQGGVLQPLSAAACTTAGAPAGCLGFVTEEGKKNSVNFGLVITGQPVTVPEPGVLGLSALALMAGAALRRRRRA